MHELIKPVASLIAGFIMLVSFSTALVISHPDAAFAKRRSSFSIFVGKDQRLKIINITVKLPPADTFLSDGPVSVTLISPASYKLRKLDVNDYYYLDRGYILNNVPGVLGGKIWIAGMDDDKLNSSSGFLQFEISDTARVHVLYDGNAASLPSWMTTLGFTSTGQIVTTSNPVADTLVVYRKIMTKGTIRLGGNEGSTTGAKCNYVVVVRRPANGDLGDPTQLATTEMQLPRMGHRVVTLNTGKVLVVGGADSGSVLVTRCELYDSTTQTFVATGTMIQGRINPALVTLADGRVLILGGDLGGVATVTSGGGSAPGIPALETCEIYNPATGLLTATGSMSTRRRLPEAILLADGRVFVSGGVDDVSGYGIGTTEIFDPATGLWTAGPNMLSMGPYNTGTGSFSAGMRYGHRMTLLPDSRVLIVGGLWHGPDLIDYAMTGCDIYDPVSNTMSAAAPMTTPRGRFGLVNIGGGKFLAMGGLAYQTPAPPATTAYYLSTADVEVYDAVTNTWTTVTSLPRGMYDFAVSSPDAGRALVFDGFDVAGTESGEILLYDFNFNIWTQVGNLVRSRSFPLSNGSDMVADVGGKDYFLCGGVHFDESTLQTSILTTGERFKY